MIDDVRKLGARLGDRLRREPEPASPLPYLRAAAAQLLLATGAGATLEHVSGAPSARFGRTDNGVPGALAWAPALIGPLAAVAHLQHARQPDLESGRAVRLLNAASLTVGSALFVYDLLAGDRPRARLAPLAFASAGLLGITLDRQELETRNRETELRRRAKVVERLVPRRRPRLDRVVVHV